MKSSSNRRPLVDLFIPELLYADTERRNRVRMFLVANLAVIGSNILVSLYVIAFSGLPEKLIVFTLWLSGALIVGPIIIITILKTLALYALCANLAITIVFLVTTAGVYAARGPLEGPGLVMILVPPVFAYILLGLKGGLGWTAITYATLMVGSVLAIYDWRFPDFYLESHISISRTIQWNAGFVSIFTVIAFYEASSSKYRQRIEYIANHDSLTLLPNRLSFYNELERAVKAAHKNATCFTLLFIDLNNFKPINDNYGHSVGDHVLAMLGRRFSALITEPDFISRLGGDEFATIIRREKADDLIDQLLQSISEPMEIEGAYVSLSASLGTAKYPEDGEGIDELLHRADMHMYAKKHEN